MRHALSLCVMQVRQRFKLTDKMLPLVKLLWTRFCQVLTFLVFLNFYFKLFSSMDVVDRLETLREH